MSGWKYNQCRLIQNHVSGSATKKYKRILSRILQKDLNQILLTLVCIKMEPVHKKMTPVAKKRHLLQQQKMSPVAKLNDTPQKK